MLNIELVVVIKIKITESYDVNCETSKGDWMIKNIMKTFEKQFNAIFFLIWISKATFDQLSLNIQTNHKKTGTLILLSSTTLKQRYY